MAKKTKDPVKLDLEGFKQGCRSEYLVKDRMRVISVMGDKPLVELMRMCLDERALAEYDRQVRNS